jgi:hypothetical protein
MRIKTLTPSVIKYTLEDEPCIYIFKGKISGCIPYCTIYDLYGNIHSVESSCLEFTCEKPPVWVYIPNRKYNKYQRYVLVHG